MSEINTTSKQAYLAGLLDADGSVSFSRKKKGAWRNPSLHVANGNLGILRFLTETFGGSLVKKQRKAKNNHSDAYMWSVRDQACLSLLKDLIPLMRHSLKKKRAEYLVGGYPVVTRRNGKYSEEEKGQKALFEEGFFAL